MGDMRHQVWRYTLSNISTPSFYLPIPAGWFSQLAFAHSLVWRPLSGLQDPFAC